MTLTVMLIIAVLCNVAQEVKDTTEVPESLKKCCIRVFRVLSLVCIGYVVDMAIGVSWVHEMIECLCLMVEGAEILDSGETTN